MQFDSEQEKLLITMKLGIIETIYFLFPKYYPRAT